MTKYTKISAIALAVCAMAAPDRLAAASSEVDLNVALVASLNPNHPLKYQYIGPPPQFFGVAFLDYELEEPKVDKFQPYLNKSNLFGSASFSNSVVKARLVTSVVLDSVVREYDETASSFANILISTNDSISFKGIDSGDTATLLLGNYADISTSFTFKTLDGGTASPPAQIFHDSQFSFTSTATIFDSMSDYLSERARPKYSHEFEACDGTRNCSGDNYLREGNKGALRFFEVDSDDVLILTNKLFLTNFVSASKTAGSEMFARASYDTDFGNSGYTFLKMLTPGTSYASESGETYLTELPAAVPEPQSWAMLLIGFGVVGGAMRRRRDARAVAA